MIPDWLKDKHKKDIQDLLGLGYNITIAGSSIIVDNIPYLNPEGKKKTDGKIVTKIDRSGEKSIENLLPQYNLYFSGERPSEKNGRPIARGNINQCDDIIDEIPVNFSLSHMMKDNKTGNSRDYDSLTEKIRRYQKIISFPIEQEANTYFKNNEGRLNVKSKNLLFPPFWFANSSIKESNMEYIQNKLLTNDKIAIIGLGGTGSYILDILSKSPVKEIYLVDDDDMEEHNSFRSPGANNKEAWDEKLRNRQGKKIKKIEYYREMYGGFRKGIITECRKIDNRSEENINFIKEMGFLFIAIDQPKYKRIIQEIANEFGVPWVSSGIKVNKENSQLTGYAVIVTHESGQLDRDELIDTKENNPYMEKRIQTIELNMIAAIQSVAYWKKTKGFYKQQGGEKKIKVCIETNDIYKG